MAILTVCVNKQRKRKDGCYSVYIRVAHNGKSVYLPTDKVVSGKGLSSSMEVIDPFVLKPLSTQIVNWLDALNRQDISAWNARQVAEFLKNLNEDLVFSDYARKHIDRMIDRGQERNAKNYQLALQHMERYFGTTKVKFAQLTSINVNKWVATLSGTARAKEMYPICIRQIFRAAIDELNDYDNGIIRVKTNPWGKVKIPAADRPNKKAITAEACRAFFAAPLPESKMIDPLPELGRDVAMMSLCLAGMNTIDIFNLCKEDYHGGIIHYKRAKTTRTRTDDAYIEMRVPEVIKPLFEKYRAGEHTDRLGSVLRPLLNLRQFLRQCEHRHQADMQSYGDAKGAMVLRLHVPAHMGDHCTERLRCDNCRGRLCDEPFAQAHGDARICYAGLLSCVEAQRESD